MKIRCIANTGSYLPESYLNPRRGYKKEMEFPLTVGKDYTVYAFYIKQGLVWYYICEDNYIYYPMRSPAPLFEVVDNRMSLYWRLKIDPNGLLEVAFEQWFSHPYFYDKLTDQQQEEVLIFDKVKELIDAEALSPDYKLTDFDQSLEMANFSS
ncbi:hypothetical protein [Planktothrix sp. FACHB-1365]|uniref:hypothetical protein n=1 Tax=Planktothrix sp. FACHB-1365 TaxID=2692855 RepID=UPI001684C748|nr:hypothetical protein [Planktothrix sp. FACHB-1365]MBD2485701.1 hypothetical protein [Planktothrix sp. FACHB-1365]